MGFRLSNIIGAPFRDFVTKQLEVRLNKSVGSAANNYNRTPEEVLYLANKTAWVSLKSSVNVEKDYAERLKEYNTETYPGQSFEGVGLAADWILGAGTSKANPYTIQDSITGPRTAQGATLRSGLGLDGAYGLGGIQAQGYRPMPGLDSVTIETAGRLGSLRFATVNFKVWNMNQLDIIDALYFRLGYTMLLEWGHTMYFENADITDTAKLTPSEGGISGFFNDNVTKEDLQYNINQKIADTYGNYDAMLGVVTNFNYSFNQEGGWDCMVRLVGIGSIIDTQKINNQYTMPPVADAILKALEVEFTNRVRADNAQRLQDERNEALRQAQDQFNTFQQEFDNKFPIKDLQSFYSKAVGGVYDPTNEDRIRSLLPSVVVGPTAALYAYNGKLYTGFIQGEFGLQTGYRYPLENGNVYGLNTQLVDSIVATVSTYRSLTEVLKTEVLKQMQGYVDNGTKIRLGTTSFGLFNQEYKKDTTITLPWSQYYRTTQSLTAGSGWSFDIRVTPIKDSSTAEVDADGILSEYANAIGTGILPEWGLTSFELEKFSLTSTTTHSSGQEVDFQSNDQLKFVRLTLKARVNAPLFNQTRTSFIFTLTTEIPSVISNLIRPVNPIRNEAVPVNQADYQVDPSEIQVDTSQIIKSDGLSSALEAMLTVVQYKGIQRALNNASSRVLDTDISNITYSLLSSLKKAPLANIFDGNGKVLENLPIGSTGVDLYKDPYCLGIKGYNTALMSGQIDSSEAKQQDPEYYYKQVPTVDFKKLMISYALPKLKFIDSGTGTEASLDSFMETPVYITLGYLLYFINNVCLLYDDTKKTKTNTARPHFYIDFHPETNHCFTMPGQLSTDPRVCLIPFEGQQSDYDEIFKRMGIDAPKDYIKPDYYFYKATDYVSKNLPNFRSSDSAYRAHTMNILLNTQYLLDVVKQTAESNDHSSVYFKSFIDRILADVNKSLGNVNAFRAGYIDSSNTVAILDDQFVPPRPGEKSTMRITSLDGNAIIPIFGATSIVRNLKYETNVSTKMSSMIAIGARGNVTGSENKGSTQSTDASSLYWLHGGLTDRVITQADDITKVDPSSKKQQITAAESRDTNQALAEKFSKQIKATYQGEEIDKAQIQPSVNYFIQSLTQTKALNEATSGTVPIPLNIEFTVDGISGINMGNVFLIPENKVPISLRGHKVGDNREVRWGYMVVGLNHNIKGNEWTTDVRGQMIRLRNDDSYQAAQLSIGGRPPARSVTTTSAVVAPTSLRARAVGTFGRVSTEVDKGIRPLLDLIAYTEGTAAIGNNNGYDVIFGGSIVSGWTNDYSSGHPQVRIPFGNTSSDAAGRYQYLSRYWPQNQSFSKVNQDRVAQTTIKNVFNRAQEAFDIAKNTTTRDPAKNEAFLAFLDKTYNIWASLKNSQGQARYRGQVSPYTVADLYNIYLEAVKKYS